MGNNDVITAYDKGTIRVQMKINGTWQKNHLENVWYVPKISRNLFSIGQAMEKGFGFWADRGGCVFKKNGIVRLTGKRNVKGLFILDMCLQVNEVTQHKCIQRQRKQCYNCGMNDYAIRIRSMLKIS